MRTLSWVALIWILVLSGCAVRLQKTAHDRTTERLAAKQQELLRLTDPVAKSRCYIAMAEALLDLAFEAAGQRDLDRMKDLLKDYDSAIEGSRNTLFQAQRKLPADAFRNFEIALRTDIRRLGYLSNSLEFDEREPVTVTLEDANRIRNQLFRALFPNVAQPSAVAARK